MKLSEKPKSSENLPDTNTDVLNTDTQLQSPNTEFDARSFYQKPEMKSIFVDTYQDILYHDHHQLLQNNTFYEIICCRNNCNAEYLVGEKQYKLQKGDIIFIPPGINHKPVLPEEITESFIHDTIRINREFLDFMCRITPELRNYQIHMPHFFQTAGTPWEYLCELINQGVKEADAAQLGWNCLICANTTNILIRLLRFGLVNPVDPLEAEKPDLLDQVLFYVEAHLSEKITLSDISRQFYVSESTITQTFRKKLGISFYRCVIQRRLMAAKKLIEAGVSLESTAEQVGFSDYSSFFRAFKQEYGIAPKQYRKLLNQ